MKRATITRTISAFTSLILASSASVGISTAAELPLIQTYSASYPSILSAIPAEALADSGSIVGVAGLLSLAASNVAHAVNSVDMSAITRTLQAQAAAWSPETTASIRPVPRPAMAATASDSAVFGTVAIPFGRLAALKKLAPSLAEMTGGSAISCSKGACSDAAIAIKAALARTGQSSIRDKLNAINSTVNHAIRYRRDIDTYKVADYWAKPSETLQRQQGDCEDFAILKMAALQTEGVSLKDMAVVVLFDQKRHFYHAVLSVSIGGSRFILDNMRDEVLADTRLPDYLPLYSIANGKGYLHGSRVGGKQMAAAMPLEKVAPGEGAAF